MLAVPVSRAGQVAGVLVVQNHTRRDYAEEDVEVLQATAMVVAELLSSGGVAGSEADIELSRAASAVIQGQGLAEGVALGHAVLHEPRIVVSVLLSEDTGLELSRLEVALERLLESNPARALYAERCRELATSRFGLFDIREWLQAGDAAVGDVLRP